MDDSEVVFNLPEPHMILQSSPLDNPENERGDRNQNSCLDRILEKIDIVVYGLDKIQKRVSDLEQGVGQDIDRRLQTPPINATDQNTNRLSPPNFRVNQRPSHIKLKPHSYDGTEDLEEYISQFLIISDLNNWNYWEKSSYLASSLKGCARAILTELSPSERQDYDALYNLLNVRFGSVERSEMFRAKLQTRVRERNESLSELAQSIRKSTRLAYPTADRSITNTLATDYFIDAIPNSDIRLRIRELKPKDINEAEMHAVRLETYRVADKQRGKYVHFLESETINEVKKGASNTSDINCKYKK